MFDEKEEKLKTTFQRIKQDMDSLKQEIEQIKQSLYEITEFLNTLAYQSAHSQQSSTQNQVYEGIKPYNDISTGNDGVPADSQQTFSTQETHEIELSEPSKPFSFRDIKKIVNSLTQDLKAKFQSLSKQEFYIFSIIYSLDIQGQTTDYKTIAIKAKLTESSVRDYVARLIHKGIPLKKEKINNKAIVISVPEELKNIATLDNLTKLKGSYEHYETEDYA